MSVIHRLLEQWQGRHRGPRQAWASYPMESDGPWQVRAEHHPDAVFLICVHVYRRSVIHVHAISHECWRGWTMDERLERARVLLEQARGKQTNGEEAMFVWDDEFAATYPYLAAFLFGPTNTKEKEAMRASLTFFFDGEALKCVLNDKATERSLWSTAPSFTGALQLLEDRLGCDTVEWRKNRPWKRNR